MPPLDDTGGSPFDRAKADLKLTQPEQNLYYHHLSNLWSAGKVEQPDGSISTVLQAVVTGPGGKFYNIPTVWNGRELPVEDAQEHASRAGWANWPSYRTPEEADARYEQMHGYMAEDTGVYQQARGSVGYQAGGAVEQAAQPDYFAHITGGEQAQPQERNYFAHISPIQYPKEKPLVPTSRQDIDDAAPGSFIQTPKGVWTKPFPKKEAAAVDAATGQPIDYYTGLEPPPAGPTALGAAARGAVRGAIPAAGGMAGFGAGAEAGAGLGLLTGPAAPIAVPALGLVGGIAGAYLGGWGVGAAQEAALRQLPESAKEYIGQSEAQRQADIAAHPYAAMAGELAPNLAMVRPGAIEKGVTESATAFQKLMAHPVTARAVGAGLMGAQEAAQEEASGEGIDPAKVAIATGAGALMNRTTEMIGKPLERLGAAPVQQLTGRFMPRGAPPPTTPPGGPGGPGGPGPGVAPPTVTTPVYREGPSPPGGAAPTVPAGVPTTGDVLPRVPTGEAEPTPSPEDQRAAQEREKLAAIAAAPPTAPTPPTSPPTAAPTAPTTVVPEAPAAAPSAPTTVMWRPDAEAEEMGREHGIPTAGITKEEFFEQLVRKDVQSGVIGGQIPLLNAENEAAYVAAQKRLGLTAEDQQAAAQAYRAQTIEAEAAPPLSPEITNEAISGLTNFGYKKAEATAAINAAAERLGGTPSAENLVIEALKFRGAGATIAPPREAPPAAPQATEPPFVNPAVPEWAQHNLRQTYEAARNLGVLNDIERMAADRQSANEIAAELGDRLPGMTPSERALFVREVRAAIGVPSMDQFAEFDQWRQNYLARQAPAGEARPQVAAAQALPMRPIREDQAFTSTGRAIPVEYAIVDARDLVTSHDDAQRENPAYPQELQPRDRSRVATADQMTELLSPSTFRPELLGEGPDAASGAPIVNPDGVVDSGNLRTMALRRAYDQNLPVAEAYRNYLASKGYPVEGVAAPMLVRVSRAGMSVPERAEFNVEANIAPQAAMSAPELAAVDARRIPASVLNLAQSSDLHAVMNRRFVRAVLDKISNAAQRNTLIDADGDLSTAGEKRIRAALLAKAYGDPVLISTLTEDANPNIKSIGDAMSDASHEWARMRAAVSEGTAPAEADITQHVVDAAKLVSRARGEKQYLVDLLKQRDMLGNGAHPITEAILRDWMFEGENLTRRVGRAKIADALTAYADAAQKPGNFVEVAPRSVRERIADARQQARGAAKELFERGPELGQPDRAAVVGEGVGEGRPGAPGLPASAERPGAPEGGATGEFLGQKIDWTPELREVRQGLESRRPQAPDTRQLTFSFNPEAGKPVGNRADDFAKFAAAHASRDPDVVARDWVKARGMQHGIEFMAIVDSRTGAVTHAVTSGNRNFVRFPITVFDALEDPSAALVVHHNHPSGLPLSVTDIETLGMPGEAIIVAHDWQRGNVSAASLTPQMREVIARDPSGHSERGTLKLAHEGILDAIRPVFMDLLQKGTISREGANIIAAPAIFRTMDAAGIIDYIGTDTGGELATRIAQKLGPALAKHLWGTAAAEEEAHARIDRSARTLRPDEAMAELSRRAQEIAARRSADQIRDLAGREGAGPEGLREEELPGLVEAEPSAVRQFIEDERGSLSIGRRGRTQFQPAPAGTRAAQEAPETRSADLEGVMPTDRRGFMAQVRDLIDQAKNITQAKIEQGSLDDAAHLKAAERVAGGGKLFPARESPTALRRLARNAMSGVRMAMYYQQIEFDPVANRNVPLVDANGRPKPGLVRIERQLSREGGQRAVDDFALWKIANRSQGLIPRDLEHLITQDFVDKYKDIDQLYNRRDGTNLFHEVDAQRLEWHDSQLKYGIATGILNPETVALFERDNYIPYYRMLNDAVTGPLPGLRSVRSPIQQLTGGTAKLNNVFMNEAMLGQAMIQRGMENVYRRWAMRQMLGTEAVGPASAAERPMLSTQEVMDRMRDLGINPADMDARAIAAAKRLYMDIKNKDRNLFQFMQDGKPVYYKVYDPNLLRSLEAAGPGPMNLAMKLFAGPTRLLRGMIVFDPAFMLAHNARMAMHATVLMGTNPFSTIAETIRLLHPQLNEDALKIMAAGGVGGNPVNLSLHVRQAIENRLHQNSLIDTPLKAYAFVKGVMEHGMQAADLGPRVAVYKQALRQNMTEAEAIDRARDLLDFSVHGDWGPIRFLAQTIPFLNARWQGLARTGRGLAGKDTRNGILMRGAMMIAATAALWEWNQKNNPDEYNRLEDWDRQYAWHFWVNGVHYRIPKPFEIGAMFGTLPEMILDHWVSQQTSTRELKNAAISLFSNVFKINPITMATDMAAIRPAADVWWNTDSYTGRPIVNESEAGDMAYGPFTSPSLVAATHAFNSATGLEVSPEVTQHLIRGYLAGFGGYLSAAADTIGEHAGWLPEQAKWKTTDIPVLNRFAREEPEFGNRIQTDFYNMKKEIDQVGRSMKQAVQSQDREAIERLQARHPEYSPALEKSLNHFGTILGKAHSQAMNAQRNPGISGEAKRRALDDFYTRRDQMMDQIHPLLRQAQGLPANP